MPNSSPPTTDIKSTFDEDGFIVIADLVSPEEIAAARTAAANIIERFDPALHPTVFTTKDRDRGRDDYFMGSAEAIHCFAEADAVNERGELTRPKAQAINKIGHALHDLDPVFGAICRLPQIAQLARDVGYRAPEVWQTMYICKPPKVGGEVRWHQDASYLATEPACVTGIWIALEDATCTNGCLWVQPGGHRSPLRERYEVSPDTGVGTLHTLDDTPWPGAGEGLALEVKAGTAIVFKDQLPHYSSHNHSNRSRHAFALHIAEGDAEWSRRNWLQRPTLTPFKI
ncbi:MAG: phytanoyl-CoA dioxygenase family protein [Gammaproteobacteria bacterium]